MANRKAVVTKAEMERSIRAALTAGLPVSRVDVAPDGTVRLFTALAADEDGPNPCDRLLK